MARLDEQYADLISAGLPFSGNSRAPVPDEAAADLRRTSLPRITPLSTKFHPLSRDKTTPTAQRHRRHGPLADLPCTRDVPVVELAGMICRQSQGLDKILSVRRVASRAKR